MSEIIALPKQMQFFFVPFHWNDIFIDHVVDTYISLTETAVTYGGYHYKNIPSALHFIEEDDMILLCDKITCDLEYGCDEMNSFDEHMVASDEEREYFQSLCTENLHFMVRDINVVMDHYKMPYSIGRYNKNLPIREVW